MDVFFERELFPAKIPPLRRAHHWVAFFHHFDTNDTKCLTMFLHLKHRWVEAACVIETIAEGV